MLRDVSLTDKTLQELEHDDWGEPTFPSHLVTEWHRLRRIPFREFTAENLRIIIGQQISLNYLMPLALDILAIDPWTSGDFYDGDLLQSVLNVKAAFWVEHPDLKTLMDEIVQFAAGIAIRNPESDYYMSSVLDCINAWIGAPPETS